MASGSGGGGGGGCVLSGGKMFGPMSRFCDYFVICGIDYNAGLEALPTYEIDGSSKSCIITHIPDVRVPYHNTQKTKK